MIRHNKPSDYYNLRVRMIESAVQRVEQAWRNLHSAQWKLSYHKLFLAREHEAYVEQQRWEDDGGPPHES